MIQRDELRKVMCQIDCEPLVSGGIPIGQDSNSFNVIAAGPFIKDGTILKRIILRAMNKGDDGVEFVVHTQYIEESYIRPDGTVDAVGAPKHYDNGDYTTDFQRAMQRFCERCLEMSPVLMGVALA
jgi:hypothetical protein